MAGLPKSKPPARVLARSCRQAFAALGAAAGQHIAATDSGHAVTEAMAALAHNLARLVGAFHVTCSIAFSPR